MKFKSITTPDIEHDEANILAEMIWLNRDLATDIFPWRGENGKEWGKLVSALKRLMGSSFGLSSEQLAFYIYKCHTQHISSPEFAKMAVVARKLFKRYNINEVCRLYSDKRREAIKIGLEKATYKQEKPKTLLTFLRELERGEIQD